MLHVDTDKLPNDWAQHTYRPHSGTLEMDADGDLGYSDLASLTSDMQSTRTDTDQARGTDLYISPLCESGDYCGNGTVAMANYATFWGDFPAHPLCYRLYGHPGVKSVAVELRAFNDPEIDRKSVV